MQANAGRIGEEFQWKAVSSQGAPNRAIVRAIRSDSQEGLSPEIEEYVALWVDAIGLSGEHSGKCFTVMLGTDQKSYLDGQEIVIQVAHPKT